MRRLIVLAGVLAACALAQEAAPKQEEVKTEAACYRDKGVDEYIVEINKRVKKGTRNPLPNNICIFGWCSDPGVGPREPEPSPPAPTPQPKEEQQSKADDVQSSSKQRPSWAPSDYDPLKAAHDTDVGDYNYREKSYRGAVMRYRDALAAKRGDPAIYIRLARAHEKLKENDRAYLAYDSALKVGAAGKDAEEARRNRERLAGTLRQEGVDPVQLASANTPTPAPCLAPPASTK